MCAVVNTHTQQIDRRERERKKKEREKRKKKEKDRIRNKRNTEIGRTKKRERTSDIKRDTERNT